MCVFFWGGDSNWWCFFAIFWLVNKNCQEEWKTVGILRCDVVEVYRSCGRKGGFSGQLFMFVFGSVSVSYAHVHMFSASPFQEFGQGGFTHRNTTTLKWGNSCRAAPPAKLEIPEIQVWQVLWKRAFRAQSLYNLLKFVQITILHGTNISHLGRRKIIFKSHFWWDVLVPWRVYSGRFMEPTNRPIWKGKWSEPNLMIVFLFSSGGVSQCSWDVRPYYP